MFVTQTRSRSVLHKKFKWPCFFYYTLNTVFQHFVHNGKVILLKYAKCKVTSQVSSKPIFTSTNDLTKLLEDLSIKLELTNTHIEQTNSV